MGTRCHLLLVSALFMALHGYSYIEEGSYVDTRLEGLSPGYVMVRPWLSFNYLRKYYYSRMTQSKEVIDYFDHQRIAVLPKVTIPSEESREGVTLGMVGDIMWIRENWGNYYSRKVKDFLHSFDAVLGNLETPIDPHQDVPGAFWPDAWEFNSYPILLTELEREGHSPFTALGIANNHSFDMGEAGLMATMKQLDGMGIGHSGAYRILRHHRFTFLIANPFALASMPPHTGTMIPTTNPKECRPTL